MFQLISVPAIGKGQVTDHYFFSHSIPPIKDSSTQ